METYVEISIKYPQGYLLNLAQAGPAEAVPMSCAQSFSLRSSTCIHIGLHIGLHLGILGIHGFLCIFLDFWGIFLDFWSNIRVFGQNKVGIV